MGYKLAFLLVAVAASGSVGGCITGAVVGGVAGATTLLGAAPGQEIEQVYYLGVYDPQDQVVPPTVYRVTVHGQASAISGMKYGSGWVPANLIDTLESDASFGTDGTHATVNGGKDASELPTARRMFMFGPEGFREAPKDYRLVIVMGQSPQAFFKAIDTSLGVISQVRKESADSAVVAQLAAALARVSTDQADLAEVQKQIADAKTKGGA